MPRSIYEECVNVNFVKLPPIYWKERNLRIEFDASCKLNTKYLTFSILFLWVSPIWNRLSARRLKLQQYLENVPYDSLVGIVTFVFNYKINHIYFHIKMLHPFINCILSKFKILCEKALWPKFHVKRARFLQNVSVTFDIRFARLLSALCRPLNWLSPRLWRKSINCRMYLKQRIRILLQTQ
jgi:hypothetical protein